MARMEALRFFKERARMCYNSYNAIDKCDNCDAKHKNGLCMVGFNPQLSYIYDEFFWIRAIDIVSKWSKEHPEKSGIVEI